MLFTKRLEQFNLEMTRLDLGFIGETYTDVFADKSNKSVAQTLAHHRYQKLAAGTASMYPDQLDEPLGTFLGTLKRSGDSFYKSFLNKYGDDTYSRFVMDTPDYLDRKGVYAFFVKDNLVYIGRCRDSMRKRINQGYGKIHPKNCYLDGQATNCHLNARITRVRADVSLWMAFLDSVQEIEDLERKLIRAYAPDWNIQRA